MRKGCSIGDLESFLETDWLERAWTFQEIILSTNATIVRGDKAISWDRLHRGLQFLLHGANHFEELGNSTCITAWVDLFDTWLNTPRHSHTRDIMNRASAAAAKAPSSAPIDRVRSVSNRGLRCIDLCVRGFFVLAVPAPLCLLFWPLALWCRDVPRDAATGSPSSIIAAPIVLIIVLFYFLAFYGLALTVLVARIHWIQHAGWPNRPARPGGGTRPLLSVARALRYRKATNARDKSFALHGILGILSGRQAKGGPVMPGFGDGPATWLRADYSKSVSEVYRELFMNLVRLWPPFICLLVDAGTFKDEENHLRDPTPSWVPDWSAVREKAWLPPSYVYGPIERNRKAEAVPSWDDHGREMTIEGVAMDTVRFCSYWDTRHGHEPSDEADSAEEPDSSPSAPATMLGGWFRQIAGKGRVDPPYESIREAVFHVLMGTDAGIIPADSNDFNAWFDAMVEAIRPSPKAPERDATAFAAPWVNRLAGKRGIFFTAEGRFGSGPPGMAEEDEILLLRGVEAPIIARRSGTDAGKYVVVGPAFIAGLMGKAGSEHIGSGHITLV